MLMLMLVIMMILSNSWPEALMLFVTVVLSQCCSKWCWWYLWPCDVDDGVVNMMVLMVVLMMMIFMTLLNVDVDVATLLTTKMLSTWRPALKGEALILLHSQPISCSSTSTCHHHHHHHHLHHHHLHHHHPYHHIVRTCKYIRRWRRPYNCQVNQAEQCLLPQKISSASIPGNQSFKRPFRFWF